MITLLAFIVVPWLALSFLAAGLLVLRGVRRDRARREREDAQFAARFYERAR